MSCFRVVAILFVLCSLALAQATSSGGDLRGTVTDPTGAAVVNAKLTLTNPDRGFSRTAETGAAGEYSFPIVPPGIYRLRAEAAGFQPKVLDGVEVRVGDIVTLPVELTVGTVQSEILVTADLPTVEVERTQQANTIEQKSINNLPINRRNYLDFAVLVPGVVETTSLVDDTSFRPIQTPNSGLSFGGSNGRGNGFFIDGVENYYNSGGVRPSVSQEAAQEFQINRNGFTAEFGNAAGGVINIITKGGTNTWRGNLFGFFRHRDIQARNYFDPVKSAFTRYQAGATAGGPIRKDKTFVFGAYERLQRRETSLVPILQDRSVFNQITPSQNALFNAMLQSGNAQFAGVAAALRPALTPANNPRVNQIFNANSGTFPFAESSDQFSVRFDHRFSENHNIFLRSNSTWNIQNNSAFGALDGFNRGRSLDVADSTATLGDTYVFSPRWIMETRAMFNWNYLKVAPNDPFGPELNINGFGFFGRQIFLPYEGIERHYQILQNFTHQRGRHDIRFGYDVNPVRNSNDSETFFGGRFTFGQRIPLASVMISATGNANFPALLGQFLAASGQANLVPNITAPVNALQSFSLGIPELYQQGFGNPSYVNFIKRNSFYAQDTWRIRPGLTLNFGARYEVEFHPPVIPGDRNNIGPRFGFAWNPGKGGKTVVRGGYGLFYSQVNAQVAGVADPLSGRFINQILLTPTSTLFRDPASGQFVTSTSVYQTLLRQGVIGNRSITEQDLRQFGITVGPNLPGSVIFGVDKDFENPWAHQASLEVERQIGDFAVSVGYNFNRAAHLARTLGRNVAYTGQRLPDGRPVFTRINPLILQNNVFESSANSFYHAGILQVTKRFSRGFSLNGNYTWSKAIDESTDFNSDYSPNDQLNHRAERALSPFHQAHRLVISGVFQSASPNYLFTGWNLAPILIYNSWRPFNVLTGVDAQGDTYVNTKRPAHLGRNRGQGPDFVTFDMRLSRRFALAGSETLALEFLAEGFNLMNRTNFRSVNNIVGDVPISALPDPIAGNRGPASKPLAFTSALNPRQFQFGVKLFW
jgi:hypothetical protein